MLAFARALGEFGATLMFAGNIPGRTNTMPLEIFAAYQAGEDARALLYVVTPLAGVPPPADGTQERLHLLLGGKRRSSRGRKAMEYPSNAKHVPE